MEKNASIRSLSRGIAVLQAINRGGSMSMMQISKGAELVRAARSHIVELTRSVGWPISLASHVGHSMVIRDSTHSLTALTFNNYYPGYAIPIIECAAGLVYLAHLSDEERVAILDGLKVLAKGEALSVIGFLRDLDYIGTIRRDGFATRGFNQFTRNPGKTSSVAVPIMVGGKPAGTLTIAFFASAMRMSEAIEKFAVPLQQCAAAIAVDLEPAG